MPVREELVIVDLIVLMIASARHTASGDRDAGFWLGTFRAMSWRKRRRETNQEVSRSVKSGKQQN